MSHELGTRTLRDLREQITRESDPEKRRELLIEINLLLSIIEEQVAKLEGRQPPQHH